MYTYIPASISNCLFSFAGYKRVNNGIVKCGFIPELSVVMNNQLAFLHQWEAAKKSPTSLLLLKRPHCYLDLYSWRI